MPVRTPSHAALPRPPKRWLRAMVAALALVVCAWFAVGARQALDTAAATAFVTTHTTATAAAQRRIDSVLKRAAWLNPDKTVAMLRGRLALEQGNVSGARRILTAVTRSEPDNVQAWVALGYAYVGDRPMYIRVLERIAGLDPRVLIH